MTLRSKRKGSGNDPTEAGSEIGRARIYTFENTDASYTGPTTKFDLYLFDIQLYTTITITSAGASQLPIGSFVEGLSSGASGFSIAAGSLTLEQVSGTFVKNEPLRINGRVELPDGTRRSVEEVTRFGLEDVLSVHQDNAQGTNIDFSGDLVLKKQAIKGLGVGDVVNISAASGGESDLTCSGKTFESLKVGNIIRYSDGTGDEVFNEVKSISSDLKTVTLESASLDIAGVCLSLIHI